MNPTELEKLYDEMYAKAIATFIAGNLTKAIIIPFTSDLSLYLGSSQIRTASNILGTALSDFEDPNLGLSNFKLWLCYFHPIDIAKAKSYWAKALLAPPA